MRVYFSDTNFDFPKKINDLRVAWYNQGKICIARNYKKQKLQAQNYQIIRINSIVKCLYQELSISFKRDLKIYASRYKKRFPLLRKRGISSYGIFLKIIYKIIQRFSLQEYDSEQCIKILRELIQPISIKEAIALKLLEKVYQYYQLTVSAICGRISQHKQTIKASLDRLYLNNSLLEQAVNFHRII